jgi:TonB family protein
MNTEHWFTAAVAAIIIHLFSAYFGLAVLQQWRKQEPFHQGAYNVRLFDSVQIPRPEKKAIKPPAAKTKKTIVKKKQIKKKVTKTKSAHKPAPKIKKAISTAPKTKKVKKKKKHPPKENQDNILEKRLKQISHDVEAKEEETALKKRFQQLVSKVKGKQKNTGYFDASSRLLSEKIIDQYRAAIFSRIQPHWTLPDFLTAHKNLNTEVLVVIDGTGRILSTSVQTSSGNRTFDDFASKAVADSDPLPEPPRALGQGPFEIVLNFVPEGMEF